MAGEEYLKDDGLLVVIKREGGRERRGVVYDGKYYEYVINNGRANLSVLADEEKLEIGQINFPNAEDRAVRDYVSSRGKIDGMGKWGKSVDVYLDGEMLFV